MIDICKAPKATIKNQWSGSEIVGACACSCNFCGFLHQMSRLSSESDILEHCITMLSGLANGNDDDDDDAMLLQSLLLIESFVLGLTEILSDHPVLCSRLNSELQRLRTKAIFARKGKSFISEFDVLETIFINHF